jgi:hypothetical protein
MISNFEIFLDFLGDNFCLTKYIVAYTKRYNNCHNPFYLNIKRKAEKNPKGLFTDILGTGHSFKKIEKKWLEYLNVTINYMPEKGDKVYCCYFDEERCAKVYWVTDFLEGTKDCFTSMDGTINDTQTFVKKLEGKQDNSF